MYRGRRVAAVVVAAGASTRMGFDKMFHRINGVEVLRLSIKRLEEHPYIDELVVVGGANLAAIQTLLRQSPAQKPVQVVLGGAARADSVAAGVAACSNASLVAIHDGARPFVSAGVISRAVEAAADCGAAAPAIPVKDTIKKVRPTPNGDLVTETVPREVLRAVQTPQVFDRATFARLMSAVPEGARATLTDDCMVMERAGVPVCLVEGEEANLKITTPADLQIALAHAGAAGQGGQAPQSGAAYDMHATPGAPAQSGGVSYTAAAPRALPRVGHGYDVHKLVPARRLILGGVEVPHNFGLLGHSDADVLAHAVSDALLGGAGLGDIGRHFPDTDPTYKGADSIELLRQVGQLVYRAGYAVANVDATILCQQPKLAPHIPAMQQNLAAALCIDTALVSVKATTEEGLGFTGSGAGIAVHCVALLCPL